jgi:hypothetical protein
MPEKRMIIVPAELARQLDENRGEMSQAEFIGFLLNHQLGENNKTSEKTSQEYATVEELRSFEHDIKKLMKSFLDFFVTYGLELGKPSFSQELEELTNKLQGLEKEPDEGNENKRATIKWK